MFLFHIQLMQQSLHNTLCIFVNLHEMLISVDNSQILPMYEFTFNVLKSSTARGSVLVGGTRPNFGENNCVSCKDSILIKEVRRLPLHLNRG